MVKKGSGMLSSWRVVIIMALSACAILLKTAAATAQLLASAAVALALTLLIGSAALMSVLATRQPCAGALQNLDNNTATPKDMDTIQQCNKDFVRSAQILKAGGDLVGSGGPVADTELGKAIVNNVIKSEIDDMATQQALAPPPGASAPPAPTITPIATSAPTAPSAVPAATAAPSVESPVGKWSGTFVSTYGTTRFSQDGDQLSGTYATNDRNSSLPNGSNTETYSNCRIAASTAVCDGSGALYPMGLPTIHYTLHVVFSLSGDNLKVTDTIKTRNDGKPGSTSVYEAFRK